LKPVVREGLVLVAVALAVAIGLAIGIPWGSRFEDYLGAHHSPE
jgi:hypothetical protein